MFFNFVYQVLGVLPVTDRQVMVGIHLVLLLNLFCLVANYQTLVQRHEKNNCANLVVTEKRNSKKIASDIEQK